MCGIAGAASLHDGRPMEPDTLARMLTLLDHRGPEVAGVWDGGQALLGHARLSIVDLDGGLQPISNEDGSIWAVINGEVFNYRELTGELRARGHHFATSSDSEVVVHLYEESGPALLDRLNGQYAIALWDNRRRQLFLARDRLGVRPLFYTRLGDTLLFASEVKALLADPRVEPRPDLTGLDQLFTYWAPLPGQTMFEGISEVPAAHYLLHGADAPQRLRRYWSVPFDGDEPAGDTDYPARLRELLVDATRLRLRADVPVGAYLSGGLDSSAIAAVAAQQTSNLQTFSVAFEDARFDERTFQEQVAVELGTVHHVIECRSRDIGEVFPDVIWHTETPVLRTAPAPLFLLSALVRRHGLKVVLTGEGADEFLGGYDIFKEAMIRRFWARQPSSTIRPLLLKRLYSNVPDLHRNPHAVVAAFFGQGLTDVGDPFYSHALRWRNTSRLKRLFSVEVQAALGGRDVTHERAALLRDGFEAWDGMSKAQHLEVQTFLTPYLLSSQGDRVAMAHSVEGRFPFLDHRVVEFAATIPPPMRMVGLQEKRVLKQAVHDLVPQVVLRRTKQPYRAPVSAAFCGDDAPDYVGDALSRDAVRDAGLFDPGAVSALLAKAQSRRTLTEGDEMALVGVLSTQLWHSCFIAAGRTASASPVRADIVHVGRQLDASRPAPRSQPARA